MRTASAIQFPHNLRVVCHLSQPHTLLEKEADHASVLKTMFWKMQLG